MKGSQLVVVAGALSRDPEVKATPSGLTITSMSIPVTEKWKKDGELKEKTEWCECVAYGKPAEILAQYLQKGSVVQITGKMDTQKWEKDGVKRQRTVVKVEEFTFLGGNKDGQPANATQQFPSDSAQRPADDLNDPLPF